MKLWIRLAEKLPTGPAAPAIAAMRSEAAEKTDDARSFGYFELYKIYSELAGESPVRAPLFRPLADHYLKQAILWKKRWPEPLKMRAALDVAAHEYWKALKVFNEYVPLAREWIRLPRTEDKERFEFARCLAVAGELKSRFGELGQALAWYAEAREEIARLTFELRSQETKLEDMILQGMVSCQLMTFEYRAADTLISNTLAEQVFSSYPSETQQNFRALKDILPELIELTKDYKSPPVGADQRARLTREIMECETAEKARLIRDAIVDELTTPEASREIQECADAILKVLGKHREKLERDAQTRLVAKEKVPHLPEPDPSSIRDEQTREASRKMSRALRESQKQAGEQMEAIEASVLSIDQKLLQLNEATCANVQAARDDTFEIPARYYRQWRWWSLRRFLFQIIGVSVVLEQIIHRAVDKGGGLLLNRFHRADVLLWLVELVVTFFLGGFVERRIDDWTLESYKRTLLKLLGDRFTTLWANYNLLLKLYAATQNQEVRLKEGLEQRGAPRSP